MFDEFVLAVDPGTAAVGLALVRPGGRDGSGPSVAWATTLRTAPGLAPAHRLERIHRGVLEVIERHRPSVVAIERLMWGRNTESAMEVARATGVVVLAAAQAGVEVEEYAPLEVKMAVTGAGNASKEDVRRGLRRLLRVQGVPKDPDAADAVAVGVCHLQQSKVRRAAAEAAR